MTDIYTRLEVLLGLKLLGQTDIPTEASNLIDDLYKRGKIQNEQQHRNAPDKFKIKIITCIFVFIVQYTYIYDGIYTFKKHYVIFTYTRNYTYVYSQLYRMDTYIHK